MHCRYLGFFQFYSVISLQYETFEDTAFCDSHLRSAFPKKGLLTLFPSSSVGSLPQETVLQELLQHESFTQAAVLHELLQRGSLPRGAVLQEHPAAAWVPLGVTSPASKPAPAWTPLSMRPRVLPGACSSRGFPWGHSLLQASTCSSVGSSTGCRTVLHVTAAVLDIARLQALYELLHMGPERNFCEKRTRRRYS